MILWDGTPGDRLADMEVEVIRREDVMWELVVGRREVERIDPEDGAPGWFIDYPMLERPDDKTWAFRLAIWGAWTMVSQWAKGTFVRRRGGRGFAAAALAADGQSAGCGGPTGLLLSRCR